MDAVRIFLLLIVPTVTVATIWIPKTRPGFVYKFCEVEEPVQMEAFLDLLCQDSKSIYGTLIELAKHYGPTCLQLRVHMNPLPYHTYAFYAGKGAFVYQMLKPSGSPYSWFSAIFKEMDNFKDSTTRGKNTTEVLSEFADVAATIGLDKEQFFGMLSDPNNGHQRDAILAWKYGATRGIHSTPMIMINGIMVPFSKPEDLTIFTWKAMINSILN